jgi:spermidine/putrescine transport system substrate-binding protein
MTTPQSTQHLTPLSRRSLVRLGGGLSVLAAGSTLLGACSLGTESRQAVSADGVRTAAQGPASDAAAPSASGQLDFLGYEGDDALTLTKRWRSEHGVNLNSVYTSSATEIQAKFLGGGGNGVDLTSQLASEAPYLVQEGILAPIDPNKVPNLRHLWPFFAESSETLLNDAGQWVAIPIYWGTIGLSWDRSVVPQVSRWADILDPAFAGRVGVIDSPQLALYAACAVLGLKPHQLTVSDLSTVEEYLRPVMAQVKTFTPSIGDLISLLGAKEIAAVFPGFAFISNAAALQGNSDAAYNIQLEEGAPVLTETVGLSANADNPDAALAYINELLTPAVQKGIATTQGAAVPVDTAVGILPSEIRKLYPYDDLASFYARTSQFIDPPVKSEEFATSRDVQELWARLKQPA